FVDLYEATKDPKYLQEVAKRGKRMLEHRDDYRGVTDGGGNSRPAWSVGGPFVVAEGVLRNTAGEEMVKIRSANSSFNNQTTVEVIQAEDSKTFTLLVRNERRKRQETFNKLKMDFSFSYLKNRI